MVRRINDAERSNFETLLAACDERDVALVVLREKGSKKEVVAVCAMQENSDGTITPVPFAVMIDENPFEFYDDPTMEE